MKLSLCKNFKKMEKTLVLYYEGGMQRGRLKAYDITQVSVEKNISRWS